MFLVKSSKVQKVAGVNNSISAARERAFTQGETGTETIAVVHVNDFF